MATAQEIREKALKKLGVVPLGHTTPSAIAADLDAAYTEVYAQLEALSLTVWDSDEEVPDEFINPVKDLVAYARIDEYAIPNDRYQRITLDAKGNGTPAHPGAVADIRRFQASNVYKQPTAEYF